MSKMVLQRVFGIVFILMGIVIIAMAVGGETPAERDATPILFLFPMGFILLFSRECWLS